MFFGRGWFLGRIIRNKLQCNPNMIRHPLFCVEESKKKNRYSFAGIRK
ncbi:hypothetical protein HMPREF9148_00858 [Prevotella sp. F0091]|nr:hypothetical protein HMPREF9148_00858 [Prevotella sp. F0091]